MWLNAILLLFSLLNIGLGIYGFVVKQSSVSLIAGLAIGVLMLATVALAQSHPRWGRIGSLMLAILVVIQFLPKFLNSGDWIPAGILAFTGIGVAIALIAGHMLAQSNRSSANPNA
jgi:uncharacterized membrane protein (UPF0136 family)